MNSQFVLMNFMSVVFADRLNIRHRHQNVRKKKFVVRCKID